MGGPQDRSGSPFSCMPIEGRLPASRRSSSGLGGWKDLRSLPGLGLNGLVLSPFGSSHDNGLERRMGAIDAVHELERPIKITVESVESSRIIRIIRIIGDVDTVTAPELDLTLSSLRAERAETLLIDMQSVTYISSMGLRVFLSHLKKMRGSGGRTILCGASHLVTDIFRMSGFTSFFEMFESLDAAMAEH